jgi:hypothetical protein
MRHAGKKQQKNNILAAKLLGSPKRDKEKLSLGEQCLRM